MRPTLDDEMPMASAMVERLQWVALGGLSCTVFAITLSRVSRGSGGTRDGRVLSRLRPGYPFVKVALLPAPDGRLRRIRAPHDFEGPIAVRRRQHDFGSPDQLSRCVTDGDQGFKLCTVSGAQIQADVIASHDPTMVYQNTDGNLTSGGEH